MLKKKNIAMMMAVATAATTAAPAFAATLGGTTISLADAEKMAELRSEIKALLDTKYTTDGSKLENSATPGSKVYEITLQKGAAGNQVTVNSMRDLEKALAELEKDEDYLTITTKDKGHSEVDGEIVNWKTTKYDSKAIADLVGNENVEVSKNGKVAQLTMKNNPEKVYLTVGDEVLNFSKPIYKEDKNENKLDKDGNIATDAKDYVVLGFEKQREDLDEKEPVTYTVKYAATNESELKCADLYNNMTDRLTKSGNELAKFIRDYNDKVDADTTGEFKEKITVPEVAEGALKFEIGVPKNINKAEKSSNNFATITINGSTSDLKALRIKLNDVATNGKLETLAGSDRIQTSIEVSKDTFAKGTAKNIVLVSDQVIADGLAATPFAAQMEAPVLLTNKDSISKELMAEIERAMAEGGKVYLVGGESVLTPALESQLDAKFIDFERIAGENREATSLEIAKRMNKVDELYVAGSYAQADSMSIAGVAAQKGNPILLVGKDGLSKEQEKWVKFNANNVEHYIVGGESHISNDTKAELNDMTSKDVSRLAGNGRQETNAKVIDKFYAGQAVDAAYIVKSDDKGLVDALSAGAATAKTDNKKAPIVLATNELVAEQKTVLSKLTAKPTVKKQVGYGIADKVWEAVNAAFDKIK